jgi:uncharacterized protein (DUF302 family)
MPHFAEPDQPLENRLMKSLARPIAVCLLSAVATLACAADGLVAIKSPHSARVTMDKLEATAKDKGLNIFARIDHAAGAASIGQTLRPTEVLILGNPKGGTPFMTCAQSVGIDLPLKALVWEDASSQVWVGYNDPAWLAQRHGAETCAVVPNLQKALQGLAAAAVAP